MLNLSSFIRFHAARSPQRIAVAFNDQRITYAEFSHRIERTAGYLSAQGIRPDDVVAVMMKNSAAFLELAFAVSHLGAVFLPINFRLAADEVEYIVGNARAKLVLADAEFAAAVANVPATILLDDAAQADTTVISGEHPPAFMHVRNAHDLFRLMYTSGTTDRPKGVMHSYDNFYWKSMDHVIALGLNRDDRLLVTGPLYHVGAFDLPGIAVLWVGGMLCIHREFDVQRVLRSVAAERLTGAWLAPVMLGSILSHPNRAAFDVSSLRWIIGGGERTPEARIRQFSEYFTHGRYIDAYGLTESCSGDSFMEAGREIEKIGSVGRALAHIEIEIRDAQGARLPASEAGEICLRGPKITRGYWLDEKKTAASFHGDWFRTGDVGYLDAEGFLYLTDRVKDMIISGGENIASSEVERVVYQMPQVREAAIIGVPDEKWGERPVAVVVLNTGYSLDYETLAEHCRAHLAGFKVPKQLILRGELPRNPSGKVLKRLLRDELQ
ncbi:MAG TPA: long-chain-fatty-acid--CoA ligase [Xanthobacteraceae bacterium]|nr:long-chain-fatty-acid--CoA ligase [Xanthobacteraceae bacterium]